MTDYLNLTGVSKRFEDTISLSSITLSVRKGEIMGILGSSGCGKTTLLKLILGLLSPSEGDILIEGHSILQISPAKRNFGYIPQTLALFSHMSVKENIIFGLKARKCDSKIISKRLAKILDLLEIDHLQIKLPHEISGGERQRVALGRALALEPALILMDEPLSSLDTKLSQQLRWQIKDILKKTNSTAIFVTHNPGEAISICDRIAIMDEGHIIQVGQPNELLNSPSDLTVLQILGKTNLFPVRVEMDKEDQIKQLVTSIGTFTSFQKNSSKKISACWISEIDISLDPLSGSGSHQIDAKILGTEWGRVRNRIIFKLPDSTQLVVQVPITKNNLPRIGDITSLYFMEENLKWI
ncbi:MAG: ABC transporter ATP-binding protein [Candidatus Hodarchaeales archaeon]